MEPRIFNSKEIQTRRDAGPKHHGTPAHQTRRAMEANSHHPAEHQTRRSIDPKPHGIMESWNHGTIGEWGWATMPTSAGITLGRQKITN